MPAILFHGLMMIQQYILQLVVAFLLTTGTFDSGLSKGDSVIRVYI